jgi:cytochrome P450
MAETTEQVDAAGVVDGAKCPFAGVNNLEDVSRLLRSKTAVTHSADLFAGRAADEVNGEINVREFLGASMMYIEGESHRLRRKLLNPLVRADALAGIREEIILPEADRLMGLWLAEPDGDGRYRMDLIEFLERVFIHFTARLIGLTGIDTDDRLVRMRSLAGPISAGMSSNFLADRDAVNERALAAKRRYVEEFFGPSLRWHRQMRAKIEAGEIAEEEVAPSLLKLVAASAAPEWADESNAVIESTLLFAASVGTSTQSIVQTIDFLQAWFAGHPEDLQYRSDPVFLLHCLQETIRLRAPFSPYTTRLSLEQSRL